MEPTSEFIDAAAWVGRQQAFAVIASKASAAQAQCLKQVKGDRLFEKLGITWEEFCLSHVGLSRQSADRLIQQYEEFGEAYFKLSELARISPQTFRQIADSVDDETITMNGEEIALVPENAPASAPGWMPSAPRPREARRRTEPALMELRMRSDALLDEALRRVSPTMPTVLRDPLKNLAKEAARRWTCIATAIEKLDAPSADDESVVSSK